MAKQLNVNLAFTADTAKAKSAIRDLLNTLSQLGSSTSIPGSTKIALNLQEALSAAISLKAALSAAVNVKTGNLDLTKFNTQLKNSGKTLEDYRRLMERLGPSGANAFAQLTQSILTAEAPIKRTLTLLDELSTTLKNTARWQVASSALHGILSAISGAWSYAQSLDRSLNDIRIVSGLSAEEMDKFADRANKAAQSLSTTTKKYADAALIFYQQGLDDKAVEERTNATIKMANVTGEAVDDVSSYMTAVWNNFNKNGTLSVEHFGDVMTKLGADTAASTEEIAGGLEKFAAVADTIGLSFEYATSAITTIVDRTRQSEDVVGTALKTIFSRIQGLSLGETLEDGTDLNKYSKALATVGISIKDSNGNLRDMDGILDDIGNKWSIISDDQKVALAQTVAGVRQYTQFMALFDNWDFMEQNLDTAYGADGTLEKQAEIYAESWEAARKRVKAAAEAIYNDLIDDDFFIDLNNGFAKTLQLLDLFIDGIGGLRSVLPLVSNLMIRVFGKEMSNGINELVYRILQSKGIINELVSATLKEAIVLLGKFNENGDSKSTLLNILFLKRRAELQKEVLDNAELLGEESAALLKTSIEELAIREKETVALQKQVELSLQVANDTEDDMFSSVILNLDLNKNQEAQLSKHLSSFKELVEWAVKLDAKVKALNESFLNGDKNLEQYRTSLEKILNKVNSREGFGTDSSTSRILGATMDKRHNTIDSSRVSAKLLTLNFKNRAMTDIRKSVGLISEENGYNWSTRAIERYIEALQKAIAEEKNLDQAIENATKAANECDELIKKSINDAKTYLGTTGETFVRVAQGLSGLATGISSIIGMGETLLNDLLSSWEKFTSILMAAPIAFQLLLSGMTVLLTVSKSLATAIAAGTAAESSNLVVKGLNLAMTKLLGADIVKTASSQALGTTATVADTAATEGNVIAKTKLLIATQLLKGGIISLGITLGAIALAIGAVVVVVKLLKAAFEALEAASPEGKLNAASESAEQLNSSLNEVKETANSITQTFENFNSIVDNLDNCTKGTQEWYQALNEANEKALEIINKYPEIASMINTSGDLVELLSSSELQNYITAKANTDVYYASLANTIGEQHLREVELDNLYNELTDTAKTVASVRAVDKDYIFSEEEIKRTGIEDEDTIANIEKYIDLYRLNEALTQAAISALASSRFTGLDDYDYADEVKSVLLSTFNLGDNYDTKLTSIKNSKKDSAELYLETLGIKNATDIDTSSSGFTYKNSAGEEVSEISWETVTSTLLSAEQDIGQSVSDIVTTFENIDNDTKDTVIKALGTTNGTINSLNRKLVQALIDANDDSNELRNNFLEAYKELYGEDGTAQLKKILTNAKQWITDVYGVFENLSQDSQDIANSLTVDEAKKVSKMFENDGFDQEKTLSYIDTFGSLERDAMNSLDLTEISNLDEFQERIRETATELGQAYLEGIADNYDFNSDELKGYSEYIQEISDESEVLADNLQDNQDAANKYTVALYRMNKGIETLSENSETWISILKNSSKESEEYYSALLGMRTALSDVLDITDTAAISADFFDAKTNAKNLELLEKAAKGDEKAIESLREAAYEDILINITSNIDDPSLTAELLSGFNELKGILDSWDFTKDCEINVNDEEFIGKLNKMIVAAGMTETQIDSIMDAMGYSANFVKSAEPVLLTYTGTITRHIIKEGEYGSGEWTEETYTEPTETTLTTSEVEAWGFLMNKNGENKQVEIKSLSKKPSGSANNHSSTNKGGDKKSGGGSKASKTEKVLNKTKRYHRIDDELDDTAKKLDKISTLEDRLYGAKRIAQINNRIKQYEKENKQLEKRKKLAEQYFKTDVKSGNKKIERFNSLTGGKISSIKLDKDGDIINYNQILSAAKKRADNWVNKLNKDPDNEKLQKKVETVKEAYEKLAEGLTKIEDTRDELLETNERIAENLRNQQDAYFEKLSYKVEVKLEINDQDLTLLQHYYDKISDQTYKRAEAIQYLWQSAGGDNEIAKTTEKLSIYNNEYKDLQAAYKKGKISQADFVEGMKEVRDGALDTAEALQDLDKQMLEYYSDTLDMVSEEIEKFTSRIDNLSSALNHYLKVMDLLGKNKSYDLINAINSALKQTAKNNYDIATSSVEMYKTLQAAAKTSLDLFVNNWKGTYEDMVKDPQYEALLKNYDAITEKFQEACDLLLSYAETYLETLNTLYENAIDLIADKIEESFTNGKGFDALNDSLSNIQTNWEEYLTPVNQAYELTKLVRKATQDLEKTDNAAAKLRYKAYITETELLKDKTEFSLLELEIQLAKYKQLQAQIALEEALNAKSVVRLSRDNEGNYGYVYTANKDNIDDAQQALDDANNDLYNIALKGLNNYGQKIIQLNQQLNEKLAEIDKKYKDDEKKRLEEKRRVTEEYTKIMTTYSNLYAIAGAADSRAIDDAWVNAYRDIITNGDLWTDAVKKLTEESNTAFKDYHDEADAMFKDLGLSADNYKETISNVTSENLKLRDEAVNKTIPALDKMSTAVLKTATAYAQARLSVLDYITALEGLAKKAGDSVEKESGSTYNAWVKLLAAKKGLYVSEADKQGVLHFSSDKATAQKYADNASKNLKSLDVLTWNNNVASNMMNKTGYFVFDNEGKLHYTTASTIEKAREYFKKLNISWSGKILSFDTGGYTGDWGQQGKLAMLHLKELVLNADDTKNFLAGVQVLRQVVKAIDLQALYASSADVRAAGVASTSSTLAQHVSIQAEFPNATNHSEIEQAFDTLINRAAQYANRK